MINERFMNHLQDSFVGDKEGGAEGTAAAEASLSAHFQDFGGGGGGGGGSSSSSSLGGGLIPTSLWGDLDVVNDGTIYLKVLPIAVAESSDSLKYLSSLIRLVCAWYRTPPRIRTSVRGEKHLDVSCT